LVKCGRRTRNQRPTLSSAVSAAAFFNQLNQTDALELAQVVVDSLARQIQLPGEARGRVRPTQQRQQLATQRRQALATRSASLRTSKEATAAAGIACHHLA
jgi:hypothetical protein